MSLKLLLPLLASIMALSPLAIDMYLPAMPILAEYLVTDMPMIQNSLSVYLFGYALGYYLFDIIGDWVINTFSSPEQFENVKQKMQAQGFWFVLSLGIVPIPFQIAMLAAGATKYSLALFLLASAIARSIRYFGLAIVVYYAGNQAERIISKHKTKAMIGLTILVAIGWGASTLI